MQTPAVPDDEVQRLRALHERAILDTPEEERFDRLTRLGRHLFGTQIALVSLVDAERQWFKSRQGLDACETGRDISFCGHAILGADIFHVADARLDPRFADNPLVSGPPHIRFYAGAPLTTVDGYRIGTLCIIDDKPRQLTQPELKALRDLADCVEAEINQIGLQRQKRELDQFKRTLDSTLDCVFMFDADTLQFFYANEGALRQLGYGRAEILNLHPYDIKPDIPEVKFRELIAPLLAGRQASLTFETVHRHKDGTRVPVDVFLQYIAPAENPAHFVNIVRDISERKAADEKLNETTQLLESIFENVPNMIFLKRASDLRFEYFNRAGEALLGLKREALLGYNDYDFFPAEQADFFTGKDRAVLAQDGVVDIPEEFIDTPHGPRILHTQKLALRDGQGRPQYLLGISEDITERKRVERMKSEFVSVVSHELRTPLTSISGALGLLAGGALAELPPQVGEMIGIAHKNSLRLSHLIDDLLDMEKLVAGKLRFDMRPQSLMPLLEQAICDNQAYADPHRVLLLLTGCAEGIVVEVDAQRLQQVLANLLSNAAKFSPEGGVVEVSARVRENTVRVEVTDHGMGIPAAFRDRLFEKFSQADSTDTRQKGGTGLGLAISRELIEHMDGRIGFESVEGEGATFYFELPVCQARQPVSDIA